MSTPEFHRHDTCIHYLAETGECACRLPFSIITEEQMNTIIEPRPVNGSNSVYCPAWNSGEWIPCAERLPKKKDFYFVVFLWNGKRSVQKGEYDPQSSKEFPDCLDLNHLWNIHGEGGRYEPVPDNAISHWRLLPQLPREVHTETGTGL